MPARRDPLREAFQDIQALRSEGVSEAGIAKLKTALKTQKGMVVSKAAALVAEWFEPSLNEDLLSCFYRLNKNGVQDDPQCLGKTACIKALHELACQDIRVYSAGCRIVQLEPVRGGKEDSAVALRIASLNALMQTHSVDTNILMTVFADFLADDSKRVRAEAAKLISYAPPALAAPLLRLKIRLGDTDTRVLGNCFDALLSLAPTQESVTLIHGYAAKKEALQAEALASLASSSLPEAIELVSRDYATILDPQLRRILLTSLSLSATQEALSFLLEQVQQALPEALWAFEALKPKLHDDEVRQRVQSILAKTGGELEREFILWQSTLTPA
jgi:hypothetical protein